MLLNLYHYGQDTRVRTYFHFIIVVSRGAENSPSSLKVNMRLGMK